PPRGPAAGGRAVSGGKFRTIQVRPGDLPAMLWQGQGAGKSRGLVRRGRRIGVRAMAEQHGRGATFAMRRREFILALGSAAAWPLTVRAQSGTPVVGFLSALSQAQTAHLVAACRRGGTE